jgi:phage terminase Nu1 subunit (DNA packaging protein)
MPEITQAQLAELLKVSEARVSQVKKTGRLDGTFEKRGRSIVFNQEAAIAAWNGEISVSPTRKDSSALEIPSFNESRAKSEHFRAELARLDLEVKEDQLVEVSRVKREAFSAARAVRDALGNIPDRVSNQMAAESDPVIIHQTLTEEIRKALETLTDA